MADYILIILLNNFVQEPTSLRQPGEITGRTVLNVFGPMGHGGRWILDSLKVNFTSSKVLYTGNNNIIMVKWRLWAIKQKLGMMRVLGHKFQ